MPNATAAARPDDPPRLIEIGWVLAGPMQEVDRQAVEEAREALLKRLRTTFPRFAWRMPLVRRPEALGSTRPVEPVRLLDVGVAARDVGRWDFAFVTTEGDLRAYDKRFALGTPSQALGVAALSTHRLDPAFTQGQADETSRREALARRVEALALHLFGDLLALPHTDAANSAMRLPRSVEDLDEERSFAEDEKERLHAALEEVADARLEEQGEAARGRLRFYARTLWHQRRSVVRAVVQVRPWQFPFRFSRLTTAAVSTLVVLIITAEAWELGMSQPLAAVVGVSVLALAGTSAYVMRRQRVLGRRHQRRLTEQRAVAHLAVTLSIALGMATTYALLFAGTLLAALTLFPTRLVDGWAASVPDGLALVDYLVFAGFVATVGLSVGALGASFEQQTYFRHIAFVDEET